MKMDQEWLETAKILFKPLLHPFMITHAFLGHDVVRTCTKERLASRLCDWTFHLSTKRNRNILEKNIFREEYSKVCSFPPTAAVYAFVFFSSPPFLSYHYFAVCYGAAQLLCLVHFATLGKSFSFAALFKMWTQLCLPCLHGWQGLN